MTDTKRLADYLRGIGDTFDLTESFQAAEVVREAADLIARLPEMDKREATLRELASGLRVCLAHIKLAGTAAEAKRLANDAFDWADANGARGALINVAASSTGDAGENGNV